MESLLNKNQSLLIKGIAILLMLLHHLFFVRNGLYDDIHLFGDHYLVHSIGVFGKLCVALFVFLSGYGLTVSQKGIINLKSFYTHRFKKLFLNYWFIWLIFVPIGVFVFKRTFADVYGTHILPKAFLDFWGVLFSFGYKGYNPTWWFYSCIITLYVLFPLLYKKLDKWPLLIITSCILVSFMRSIPPIAPISDYLLPFVTGIWMAKQPVNKFDCISIWEVVICFIGLAIFRNFSGGYVFIIDTLLCVCIALFVNKVVFPKLLNGVLIEFGKHSMNIFLFHTFIYLYWFTDLIYFTRNPLIIFLELTIVCYLISVIIEFVKRKVGFYRLV